MATYLKKDEILHQWKDWQNGNLLDVMEPTMSSGGSTFGANSVRISGSPEFVKMVMARFPELQNCETAERRLAVSMQTVEDTTIKGEEKHYNNKAKDAIVAYLQLHVRLLSNSVEAQVMRNLLGSAW